MATPIRLTARQRMIVLMVAFSGLVFDGFELGLMPIASLSVSKSLLGSLFTKELGGIWFARFTASLMFGAACGGIVLGNLGDRFGRTKAMSVSILLYSVFQGLGGFVRSQEEMLVLRFLVGVGVGGMLPNAVALVSECWPNASRPLISGIMGAGINVGILLLGQVNTLWPLTEENWRWLFQLSALPALVGIFSLFVVPESPTWLAKRGATAEPAIRLRELFGPDLVRVTIVGILLGAIPLVGAWAAAKWMLPWTDHVASATNAGYKGTVQSWWAVGAVLGSFFGSQIAAACGRRLSYFLISLGSLVSTAAMFLVSAPLHPSFLPVVLIQGFLSTLFFGWLPLYLPELFPTRARASGMGLSYNVGRFATAIAVLLAGNLLTLMGGSFPQVGATCGIVYFLGMVVIFWGPDTSGRSLE